MVILNMPHKCFIVCTLMSLSKVLLEISHVDSVVYIIGKTYCATDNIFSEGRRLAPDVSDFSPFVSLPAKESLRYIDSHNFKNVQECPMLLSFYYLHPQTAALTT